MRSSFVPAKKPSERLSGDQNGNIASSVPGNGAATSESSGRTHSCNLPAASRAVKASFVPSGEIAELVAGRPPVLKLVPGGAETKNRVIGRSLAAR